MLTIEIHKGTETCENGKNVKADYMIIMNKHDGFGPRIIASLCITCMRELKSVLNREIP